MAQDRPNAIQAARTHGRSVPGNFFGGFMRREQKLGFSASYPKNFDLFATPQPALESTRKLLKPSLLLQFALLALLAAFFPGAQLHAQTGSITGTVTDP